MTTHEKKPRQPTAGAIADKIYRLRLATDQAAATAAQRVRLEYAKREKELLESLPEGQQARAIAMAYAAIEAEGVAAGPSAMPLTTGAQPEESEASTDNEPDPQLSPALLKPVPPAPPGSSIEVDRSEKKAGRK